MSVIRRCVQWLDDQPLVSQFIITYAAVVAVACTIFIVTMVLVSL